MKKVFLSLAAGAVALFATSIAGDIAPCPDDYSVQAVSYVESRLEDARAARVQIVSEPYRVAADFHGHGAQGWGVDVKVKSRLPTGSYGGYIDYTVIFVDGEAVALCEDTDELTRV
jgi:hypothetical protein